jgi:hypothetical protein
LRTSRVVRHSSHPLKILTQGGEPIRGNSGGLDDFRAFWLGCVVGHFPRSSYSSDFGHGVNVVGGSWTGGSRLPPTDDLSHAAAREPCRGFLVRLMNSCAPRVVPRGAARYERRRASEAASITPHRWASRSTRRGEQALVNTTTNPSHLAGQWSVERKAGSGRPFLQSSPIRTRTRRVRVRAARALWTLGIRISKTGS